MDEVMQIHGHNNYKIPHMGKESMELLETLPVTLTLSEEAKVAYDAFMGALDKHAIESVVVVAFIVVVVVASLLFEKGVLTALQQFSSFLAHQRALLRASLTVPHEILSATNLMFSYVKMQTSQMPKPANFHVAFYDICSGRS
jgi:hypothetical protein